MSMKRILGMMLASKMAGRGARGGMGGGALGGLGGMAAGGLLGGRRGGMGQKAGLAALGYMAYRAYQDHQARNASGAAGSGGSGHGGYAGSSGQGGATGHADTGVGLTGALGGIMKSVSDALGGGQGGGGQGGSGQTGSGQGAQAELRSAGARWDDARSGDGGSTEPAFAPEAKQAAATFSEDTALLLVRAMVAAANADGSISAEERSRIMSQADEAGADAEDRRDLEHELANPRPLEELLGQVRDQETAEEFYLASRMAIDDSTEAHRAYLFRLRQRLGLGEQEASEIEALAT